MNIHHFTSSYKLQESSQNSPKLSSPSYTKTTESLYSPFINSRNTFMTPTGNHSQETFKKNQPNSIVDTGSKPEAKLPEANPYLTVDSIKWNNDLGFFTSDMELKLQYTVTKQLEENISWQVTYLGSAYSEKNDQLLIQFETEENQKGSTFPEKRQFKLTIQPPKWDLISPKELFNITAITISAFYKGQEFVKIGFYVHYQMPTLSQKEKNCLSTLGNHESSAEKQDKKKNISKKKKLIKKDPKKPQSESKCCDRETQERILQEILQRTIRTILGDKPRITKFPIDWEKQTFSSNLIKMQSQGESTGILQNQHLITQYIKPQGPMTISEDSE